MVDDVYLATDFLGAEFGEAPLPCRGCSRARFLPDVQALSVSVSREEGMSVVLGLSCSGKVELLFSILRSRDNTPALNSPSVLCLLASE